MFRFLFGTWKGRLLVLLLGTAAAGYWGIRRLLGWGESEFDQWSPPSTDTTTAGTGSTDVDASLLEILACPEDKEPVIKQGDKIVCTHCGKRYPIRDGIPVMLIDEAEPGPVPTAEEVAAARAALKSSTATDESSASASPAATASAPAVQGEAASGEESTPPSGGSDSASEER